MRSFLAKFTVLRGAVPQLWVIFASKVLAIVAYSVMNMTLVLWLSADLGYSDTEAGFLIAAWSSLMTLFTVLVGSFVDAVGLRRALLLGFAISMLSRAIMTSTTVAWFALPLGLMPLALGEALLTPVMVAAVKRFSTERQRSMAFSVFYTAMNVGFAGAGWIFDALRQQLGEYGHYKLPLLGATLSTYRTLFLVSVVLSGLGLIAVYLSLRDEIEVTDAGAASGALETRPVFAYRDALPRAMRLFTGLWQQPGFYRFLVFLTLIVGVRLIFYHMYYTFPKYGIRELGAGAPIGQLFGVLNAVMIIALVPVVGALTQGIPAYRMVSFGSLIAALSVFFIAVPPAIYEPLATSRVGDLIVHAWLGISGIVDPRYMGIFLFVCFLSLGEALWSPKLYEYTAAIAPQGQEASYMSLSFLPFFIAKFFVGMLSGFLLGNYCPETGPRDCETLWLLVGLMALITPSVCSRYGDIFRATSRNASASGPPPDDSSVRHARAVHRRAVGVFWLNYSPPSPITRQNLNLSSPRRFLTQERSSSMPSFLIVSHTEDFRVLLAQLLAIEWPDVEVEDWELRSGDKTPTPWPRVDLVLLDCGASHSEGLEWLRRAPASPESPPIIALTDPEDSEAAAQAVALGAAACLSRRDVSRVRLTAAINAVLQRQVAGEASAEVTVDSEKTLLLSELGVEPLPSATVADPPGSGDHARIKIDGYQVIRELAKGGMSIIFLAKHLRAGTTVALKVLDEKLLEDEQFITLFIREYGLIASIQSRYVVKIYDQGFTDLNAYIVMEYFCHGALKDRLKSRAFARHEAMAVFYEILMSLRDIHAHGIVHHDLKPQNIMFRSDGGLALIDFGISTRLDTQSKQAVSGTETILGTPHYMSPEQCEGRHGDHRSDLYSTGAILYEMLTGAKPFTARDWAALLRQHINAPIPRLPAQLSAYQALVDRLLAKRPEDRYQSASEVLDTVDRSFVPHKA